MHSEALDLLSSDPPPIMKTPIKLFSLLNPNESELKTRNNIGRRAHCG